MKFARKIIDAFSMHTRIISALMFREAITLYGRENIGALWVIGEPLSFALGVFVMWSFIRPPYEHGLRLLPFLMTGYLPLTMMRHTISHGLLAIRVNTNLLYHRKITLLHLFVGRALLEIVGATLAFIVAFVILYLLGLVEPPPNLDYVYLGWSILALMTFGMALVFCVICQIFEFLEKFVVLLTYVLVPFSGAFFMIDWLPYQYQGAAMKIPFLNCMEMIRRGFFGEFYPTHFDVFYALAWAVCFTFLGLLLLRFVRDTLELE